MKKILVSILAVLSLVACDGEKSDKPVITIGASLPLTGDMSLYGHALKKNIGISSQ